MALQSKTTALRVALWVGLGLLLVDSAIGLGLVASAYQYSRASHRPYGFYNNGELLYLNARPASWNGITSILTIAACGSALLLTSVLGMLTLFLRRPGTTGKAGKVMLHIWLVLTAAVTILVIATLAETFTFYRQHRYLSIFTGSVQGLMGLPYRNGYWLPETWYRALLALPLSVEFDRVELSTQYKLSMGWRWNLVPLLILSVAVFGLGVAEAVIARREARALRVKTEELQAPQEVQHTQTTHAV